MEGKRMESIIFVQRAIEGYYSVKKRWDPPTQATRNTLRYGGPGPEARGLTSDHLLPSVRPSVHPYLTQLMLILFYHFFFFFFKLDIRVCPFLLCILRLINQSSLAPPSCCRSAV